MDRRSFIRGVLAASAAPMFLPGAGRVWLQPSMGYTLYFSGPIKPVIPRDPHEDFPPNGRGMSLQYASMRGWPAAMVCAAGPGIFGETTSLTYPTTEALLEASRIAIKQHAQKHFQRPVIKQVDLKPGTLLSGSSVPVWYDIEELAREKRAKDAIALS